MLVLPFEVLSWSIFAAFLQGGNPHARTNSSVSPLARQAQQLHTFRDLVAGLVKDVGDNAVGRRRDGVFHLHRFEDHHRLAAHHVNPFDRTG